MTELIDIAKGNLSGMGSLGLILYISLTTLRDINKQLKANWEVIDGLKTEMNKHTTAIAVTEASIEALKDDVVYLRGKLNGVKA